jgi:predicted nucleotidyltransferase
MPRREPAPTGDLPEPVARVLAEFVGEARAALGDTLRAVVLFGSAAENRLRATSDVNLVVVLERFPASGVAALRAALLRAHAAIRLEVMWLLAAEIPAAADAFAVKFIDIVRRHRVLFGDDPFAEAIVSRQAAISRLGQVLLNQMLRLRAGYAIDGDHEERLAIRVADAAAPLRVGAAEILQLEGGPDLAPRDALLRIGTSWEHPARDMVLRAISEARESRQLEPGRAGEILLALIDLAGHLHTRAAALS